MGKPLAIRKEIEKAALELSGLNRKEKEEYWPISETFDKFWDASGPKYRTHILDLLYQWEGFIEDGLGPEDAKK